MSISNQREILLQFLKEIINDIETSKIDDDNKMKLIGQFMMEYKFNSTYSGGDIDEKNIKKYLFLGWYIYTFLINNN